MIFSALLAADVFTLAESVLAHGFAADCEGGGGGAAA